MNWIHKMKFKRPLSIFLFVEDDVLSDFPSFFRYVIRANQTEYFHSSQMVCSITILNIFNQLFAQKTPSD